MDKKGIYRFSTLLGVLFVTILFISSATAIPVSNSKTIMDKIIFNEKIESILKSFKNNNLELNDIIQSIIVRLLWVFSTYLMIIALPKLKDLVILYPIYLILYFLIMLIIFCIEPDFDKENYPIISIIVLFYWMLVITYLITIENILLFTYSTIIIINNFNITYKEIIDEFRIYFDDLLSILFPLGVPF